ncbi:MAG: hypothetical protein J6A41_03760 [Ruminiclostridium sp.]|nr:hypothetical protein [Ruminiclostridium sp.]
MAKTFNSRFARFYLPFCLLRQSGILQKAGTGSSGTLVLILASLGFTCRFACFGKAEYYKRQEQGQAARLF